MAYFIYENFPNGRVIIHCGSCRFCNNGLGVQRNILGNANGQWHVRANIGYDTYEEAALIATRLAIAMNTNYHDCQKCQPNLKKCND